TLAGRAPTGAPGPRPIFVCGMFRSGSTLAEQLIAGHPGVAAGGELELLPVMIARELLPFPESLAAAPEAKLMQLAAQYRERIAALFPHAACVTDKRPDNFFCIGLIRTLFPDALIVHTTRDALDNCLSVYFLHLDPRMSYALHLMDTGHFYRQYRRLMAHWKELYGAAIVDFDYDRFVSAPETTGSGQPHTWCRSSRRPSVSTVPEAQALNPVLAARSLTRGRRECVPRSGKRAPPRYFRNEVDRAPPRRGSDRGLPFLPLSRCCALLRRGHAHHRRDQLLVCMRNRPYP